MKVLTTGLDCDCELAQPHPATSEIRKTVGRGWLRATSELGFEGEWNEPWLCWFKDDEANCTVGCYKQATKNTRDRQFLFRNTMAGTVSVDVSWPGKRSWIIGGVRTNMIQWWREPVRR